jgi:hypothetical protein
MRRCSRKYQFIIKSNSIIKSSTGCFKYLGYPLKPNEYGKTNEVKPK